MVEVNDALTVSLGPIHVLVKPNMMDIALHVLNVFFLMMNGVKWCIHILKKFVFEMK